MEMVEGCKGCLTAYVPNGDYGDYTSCVVKIPFISNTVKCPCMDCLVKMVCGDMCEKFTLYKEMSELRHEFESQRYIKSAIIIKKGDI